MGYKELHQNAIDGPALESSVGAARIDLSGEVSCHHQCRIVEVVVREMSGVAGVFDQTAVAALSTGIKQRIASALAKHAKPEPHSIEITVQGATVTITGAVGNWDERFDIERIVWSVNGVRDVVDQLHVV